MKKSLLLWSGLILVFVLLVNQVGGNFGMQNSRREVDYSQFLNQVSAHEVQSASIDLQNATVSFIDRSGNRYITNNPEAMDTRSLIGDLRANDVTISAKPLEKEGLFTRILLNLLPFLLLIGLFMLTSRQIQGGRGGALSFGKSNAREIPADQIKVTFKDVAGAEEAKQDVEEMVDFLRNPKRFSHLGGQIPRGLLMVGPPGTGKTLLARAIAGEAKVPFFSISGSDFVEMFVGVGASRVRDLFKAAKEKAPCIIFIDEIDAVGRKRSAGVGGGHDEREQTLNQLLVEMDGFEGNEGVIVIAATNRPDVLDHALLRPGRFDRQVVVGLPDLKGREQILKVHIQKKPISDDVKIFALARGTPGFSGADLANLVNEAALFAARRERQEITMKDMEDAKDKIMMGAERRSMVMSDKEKEMTAYHEAGHCIVGRLMPEHDPVYKVTIIPRGRALGVTMFLPEKDQYSHSRLFLESKIATLFGGRLAEEIIYGTEQVTTGASNDIEKATSLARNMVMVWGLSEKLGPLTYEEDEVSAETARLIDAEIRAIIDRNYQKAEQILRDNEDILHAMTAALMKYETIDEGQIDDLMARRPVRVPADWDEIVEIERTPPSAPSSENPPVGNEPTEQS